MNVLFYALLFGGLAASTHSQTVCPFGCSCNDTHVSCSGLSYIPNDIPRGSNRIQFQNMTVEEIPSNSFPGFTENVFIEFVNVSVAFIRSFAFVGLSNADIYFENVKIDVLESFAISEMDTVGHLTFNSVSIGVWQGNAVSSIKQLQFLDIIQSVITSLYAPFLSKIDHLGFVALTDTNIPQLSQRSFAELGIVDLIYVYQSRIGEISTSAFWNITYIDSLVFTQCQIDVISKEVFSDVREIGLFSFYEVQIKTVRRRAISDIDRLHNIGILDSEIDLMESLAISDLDNTSSVMFTNSRIGTIESFAFNDVTTKIFQFRGNQVNRLECGTFEKLKDTVSDDFQFVNNTVNCNNSICWIFHPNRTYYLDAVFKDVQCAQMEYPRLGIFSETPFTNLPFGCSEFNYTADFICNGSHKTRMCPTLLLIAAATLALLLEYYH